LWKGEACDLRDDPASGARIVQLSMAAAITNNIYGEQPYCSRDGTRIAVSRARDYSFDEEADVLVVDVSKLWIGKVDRMLGPAGISTSAWSGMIYYTTPRYEVARLDLNRLEREIICEVERSEGPQTLKTVSPDHRTVISLGRRLEGPGGAVFQVLRLDLESGQEEVMLEHPEICNPHLQYEPLEGKDILVQHNRGVVLKRDGTLDRREARKGVGLFVIDRDGGDLRQLAAGPPHTCSITGHECFIPGTSRVLFSTSWDRETWELDPRYPQGNLMTVAPGDDAPVVFEAPEHRFNHISVSRCGTYFVADSYGAEGLFRNGRLGPIALVVGNLQTGKYRALVEDTMALSGGNQCTHTHPYLTSQNEHVIFNANPYHSVPQVYMARVPEGFLESLS